jgi:hypothetical protein
MSITFKEYINECNARIGRYEFVQYFLHSLDPTGGCDHKIEELQTFIYRCSQSESGPKCEALNIQLGHPVGDPLMEDLVGKKFWSVSFNLDDERFYPKK